MLRYQKASLPDNINIEYEYPCDNDTHWCIVPMLYQQLLLNNNTPSKSKKRLELLYDPGYVVG